MSSTRPPPLRIQRVRGLRVAEEPCRLRAGHHREWGAALDAGRDDALAEGAAGACWRGWTVDVA
eukprot:6522021-Alexandrium_andersonii.AAC.1